MIHKQIKYYYLLTVSTLLLVTGYVSAHSGPLNKVAIQACGEKQKSQSCQYQDGHNNLYIGSCQYMADDLMCVRNQPIKKVDKEKDNSIQEIGEHKHTHNT